jgi:hypothetical protein
MPQLPHSSRSRSLSDPKVNAEFTDPAWPLQHHRLCIKVLCEMALSEESEDGSRTREGRVACTQKQSEIGGQAQFSLQRRQREKALPALLVVERHSQGQCRPRGTGTLCAHSSMFPMIGWLLR